MRDLPEIVPLPEIQRRTGLGRDAVRQAIKAGQLPGYKIGGRYVVPRVWFERWMAGEPAQPAPDPPRIPFLRKLA